jgi:PAS domain S-box-containing protein
MANDAIFLMDYETGLFVDVNKSASELTGYSESELKQMGINALTSIFDLNRALEQANVAIEEGAARFDDISIHTKKGAVMPVDISASGVTIDGTRHVFAIVRDIKERKAFERKISEKAERLELVNEIAHAISSADLNIEAVLTVILEGLAGVISVEAGSILRVVGDELLFMVALGEKAESVKPFRLRLGQGIAGWVAETGENLIVHDVHEDPRYYPDVERATGFVTKSILAVPMKTRDDVIGVIELINKIGGRFTKKDIELITAISSFAAVALEHARLYSECELTKSRLLQMHSAASSSQLAAVVAKEMKDPLGIVKNYVHILIDRLASDNAQCEELTVVSDEADRIASITDQLLHYSEAFSEQPKHTPINLLIGNAIESMRQRLDMAGIETELNLARTLPEIYAIPNQMKLVFGNLTRLALTEMPDGGTLTITTRKRGSFIWVEFSNTGTSHTSEEADELFLPSAVAKGLVPKGLGLYLAHNIIQSYGGDIEVVSRKGKGNTFRITLPIDTGSNVGGVSD